MSGIVGSAGSKSGVIGEAGGVSSAFTFVLDNDWTTNDTTITGWNQSGDAMHKGGSFGGGLSESSGIFTFNKTGMWHVFANLRGHHHDNDTWTGFSTKFNNAIIADSWAGRQNEKCEDAEAEPRVTNFAFNHIFSVTASTDNVRFHAFSLGTSSHILGKSGWNSIGEMGSSVTFIRLRNH
tara:strand:+ start:464 stop:1003 length:540 start_codon:yes stop_codon:yes gene_type:complete